MLRFLNPIHPRSSEELQSARLLGDCGSGEQPVRHTCGGGHGKDRPQDRDIEQFRPLSNAAASKKYTRRWTVVKAAPDVDHHAVRGGQSEDVERLPLGSAQHHRW